jgi:hypothetical protein
MDILTNKLSPSIIDGLIIFNIESVGKKGKRNEFNMESWITTLIKMQNQKSFVLCVSENCEVFLFLI